ncbi:DUF4398 domain-containing protein [Ectothiorhodospira sp. PHS-1]|uniref:DUF4398 domain-containing protein n=1 Tax=Ectothiorhodospira sp. PHS-1 TaxID=519989 RepID=UPI001FEF44F0|nr:DUF4398 domain-containing protein [Ectothiorhodospira sp. PHS-1]
MPTRSRHRPLFRHLLIAVYVTLLVTGCATMAPVQEMSDARQALRAAEEVGAPVRASETYGRSRSLLEQAESSLSAGEFQAARRQAREARALAIEARIRAAE